MSIDTFLLSSDTTDLNYPEVRPTLDLNFARVKALDPRITFTRASGGTYVGADGLIKYAGVNEPRFDHDPVTGESLGFLVEEARTNLATYSTDFSQAAWTKSNSTVTANTAIAPDGTLTASLLLPNVGSSPGGEISRIGTNGIFSIYVKRQNARYCGFTSWGYFGGNVYFDLDTGNIVSGWGFHPNFGTVTPSIAPAGNGWYRISITATNESNRIFRIFPSATSGTSANNPPTGDGTSGIYIWGAQLEADAFPTSYIPTEASSRTRAADVASITGTNFSSWFRQGEGSFFINSAKTPTTNGVYFLCGDATDYIRAYAQGDGGSALQYFDAGPASTITISNSSQYQKRAFAYKVNDIAASINASTASTASSGQAPVASQLLIGNSTGSINCINGTIARLTYYPKRLTDAQLQVLTR